MFKKLGQYLQLLHNRYHHIECSIKPYTETLDKINMVQLANYSDQKLIQLSAELKRRAHQKAASRNLLVESFALVRETSRRVLGMTPYDVQIMAGIALHHGSIVEMQTGEGKTLSAVMPAYLNALCGQGVHILTFNHYLARRDAVWMAPIYDFLGMKASYVVEDMSFSERQEAYSADVTYITAKEAGFDYLRDSLCMEPGKLVHRPFHYAIVDEADSILIDEARIPLVIAGKDSEQQTNLQKFARIAKQLRNHRDYRLDQNCNNIYLTDTGLSRLEKLLGQSNLYEEHHIETLARINSALYAEVLLKKDIDYLVRNESVELIDEITGRVAENRHWPEGIQAAVEAKEKIESKSNGRILGSIALQHYLSLYPKLAGMTGTASTSSGEFHEFYGKEVVVIPPNKPCIRKDHPPLVFTHKEAKHQALLKEILRAHQAGQPVLIGTGSVQDSEKLALELKKTGINCRVLNAKNDAMEARIIAQAGEPGAVTVSTNMAGRGIDIKLGGENEQEKAKVVAAGGLYIIGTTLHESRRIDNQLKGRAGRQGDPGESRFFISIDDEFVLKYEIDQLIPPENYPQRQEKPLEDNTVLKELARGRRIVEGYHGDIRRQLWKYSSLIEEQRRIIHSKRLKILKDEEKLDLLLTKAPDKYHALLKKVDPAVLHKVEKQLTLYYLNTCWAEYLDHISYLRETIHLVVYGKKNPLDEFHRCAIEVFDQMIQRITTEIVRTFNAAEINQDGIDLGTEGLRMPAATWTYLMNDNPPNQFRHFAKLIIRSRQ